MSFLGPFGFDALRSVSSGEIEIVGPGVAGVWERRLCRFEEGTASEELPSCGMDDEGEGDEGERVDAWGAVGVIEREGRRVEGDPGRTCWALEGARVGIASTGDLE